ncbi:MAG: hypothetical protein HY684_06900 [Chloroflexi bacterium]|nr:hypothetical protein [Chloroflexota bacterium]
MASIASTRLPVGYLLPRTDWTIKFRKTWEPERWVDNVHRADGAQKHGYRGGLSEGSHMTSKLAEPLVNFFGEHWYKGGRLKVKVLPAYEGESLFSSIQVTGRIEEEGRVRYDMSASLVKTTGEVALVGEASCAVPYTGQPLPAASLRPSKEGVRTREQPLYGHGKLGPQHIVPHTWEGIVANEVMGPVDFTVRPESHVKSLDALNIFHSWFWDASPWGGPMLLPCETWCMARVLSRWKYGPMNRQLWTFTDWTFLGPTFVGEPLYGWLRVTDKYWKREKPYVLVEAWVENARGEVVFRSFDELLLLLSLPRDVKLR